MEGTLGTERPTPGPVVTQKGLSTACDMDSQQHEWIPTKRHPSMPDEAHTRAMNKWMKRNQVGLSSHRSMEDRGRVF
jgi:hypothetical protein